MAPDEQAAPIEQETPAVVSNETAPVNDTPAPSLESTPELATPKEDDNSVRADILRAAKEETDKLERARDKETGRFAKEDKPKVKTEAAPKEAAPAKEASPKTEATPTEKPSTAIREAPKSWPKEQHELWKTLPQAAHDFLSMREEQISRGYEQYGPVKQVFDRYQPMFQSMGVPPQTFVENAVSWHQAFSNPATRDRAVSEFLASYGINPSTVPHSPEQAQQPQFDVNALQPVIQNQVRQATAPLQEQLTAWQQERTQAEINSWSKDKPHFEKVKVAMGKAMATGVATTLDEAYQAATWADPTIRAELVAAEIANRTKADQERAQKAKAAIVSAPSRAPSAPVGGQLNGKGDSVRDSINTAIATLQGEQRA